MDIYASLSNGYSIELLNVISSRGLVPDWPCGAEQVDGSLRVPGRAVFTLKTALLSQPHVPYFPKYQTNTERQTGLLTPRPALSSFAHSTRWWVPCCPGTHMAPAFTLWDQVRELQGRTRWGDVRKDPTINKTTHAADSSEGVVLHLSSPSGSCITCVCRRLQGA